MCKCDVSKTSFTAELRKAVTNQNKTGNKYGVYFDDNGNPYNLPLVLIKQRDSICCYQVPTNFNIKEFNGNEFKKVHK